MKPAEIKYRLGKIRKLPEDVDETRTIDFVISDETKDRHGSVLAIDKWELESFNSNGIVGYQHNVYGGDMCNAPDPDQVIGKGSAFIDDGKLIGRVIFEPKEINEFAEKIFQKVKFGTLKATSVGFSPTKKGFYGSEEKDEHKGGKNETYYYDGQELVEFSVVNIPSNKNALKRSLRDQTANALMYINRELGGVLSFSEIEDLTVGEVIQKLNRDGFKRDKDEAKDTALIEQQKAEQEMRELKLKKQEQQFKFLGIKFKYK